MLAYRVVPIRELMHNMLSTQRTGRGCTLQPGDLCTSDPLSDPYHKLVFLRQSIESISMEGVTCTLQRVLRQSHRSRFSLLCSSGRFMYALRCTWDSVHYHQNKFHQIVICLNMPKKNHLELDSRNLKQHWLHIRVEPNCLLTLHGSSLLIQAGTETLKRLVIFFSSSSTKSSLS